MSYGLLILPSDPDGSLRWAVGGGERLQAAGEGASLQEVPPEVRQAESLVVILPGEKAASRRLTLPVKGDRALNEAASLAFEDVLAEPVEGFHFAFGPLAADGTRMVSAVPVDWLTDWMARLAEVGLDPDLVTVDHLAITVEGQPCVMLREGARLVASLPAGGVTAAASLLEPLLGQMADGAKVLSVGVGAQGERGDIALEDGRALSAFYLSGFEVQVPPSFRRGAFRKRRDWRGFAKSWQTAAALVAACFGLWLVNVVADGIRHDRAVAELTRQSTQVFTEAFPGTVVRDLRRQAAQRAAGGGGASAFLPLSAALAETIEDSQTVQLTGLRFTLEGELIADLTFPDAAALEDLQAELAAKGVTAREGSQLRREENGDFSGQLYMEGGR